MPTTPYTFVSVDLCKPDAVLDATSFFVDAAMALDTQIAGACADAWLVSWLLLHKLAMTVGLFCRFEPCLLYGSAPCWSAQVCLYPISNILCTPAASPPLQRCVEYFQTLTKLGSPVLTDPDVNRSEEPPPAPVAVIRDSDDDSEVGSEVGSHSEASSDSDGSDLHPPRAPSRRSSVTEAPPGTKPEEDPAKVAAEEAEFGAKVAAAIPCRDPRSVQCDGCVCALGGG